MVTLQNRTCPNKPTTSPLRTHLFGPSRLRCQIAHPWLCLALLALACAPHPTSESARSSSDAATAQAAPSPSKEAPSPLASDSPAEPDTSPSTKEAQETRAAASSSKEKAGHDVVYRVSPDAIVILALGAEFRPEVKTKRVQGGHQVTVKVEVKATQAIQLLSSKAGPLAMSARVRHPQEEFHHDERGESKLIELSAGETQTFERVFPSLPGKPLARGDEAELRFGLWGLGTNEEDRLPVKKFFVVKVSVDKQGAHAKLDVPEGTSDEM